MKKILGFILVPCIVIAAVQFGLANPATRELFTKIDNYENRLKSNASTANSYVVLTLEEGLVSDNITVYMNSRQVGRFSDKKIQIPVACSGVMEIRNDTNSIVKITVENFDCSIEVINNVFSKGIKSLCRIN